MIYVLAELAVSLLELGTARGFLEFGASREHLAEYKLRRFPTSELKSKS
jgi:hypothetical protein